MKIGIITHYNVHNHGALLQLYALQRFLEGCGSTAKALTFKKNFDFMEAGIDKKYDISVKSLFWYMSYISKIGLKRAAFNVRKKAILDKFKKPLLGEYYSRAEGLDAVFIGSDEVFSIEAGVNPFFFGIGVPCDRIYAYAACCGPTDTELICRKYMKSLVKAGLADFKKISVRDKNTYDVVCALAEREPEVVCDPVILYGFAEEIKNVPRKINGDYLLIYSYDKSMNNSEDVKKIKAFARKNGLKTVSAGFYHKWCDKCVDGDPIELLGYFKYAKYVVTDTFHGSVMSMITNAEFSAKIRGGNRNKLYDLLSKFKLSDRLVEDFSGIEDGFERKTDYGTVNALLEKSREKSAEFIMSCLNEDGTALKGDSAEVCLN